MYTPKTPYTEIALQSLIHYLAYGNSKNLILSGIPKELYRQKRGCFVSMHKSNGDLRGCIGTIEPKEQNLVLEISNNAISAAMRDSRFKPVTPDELEDIELSVDVLTKPEPVVTFSELDPLIFGVVVSDGMGKKAVLLPGLQGIDTVEKQLGVVKCKAGLADCPDENLVIYRFTSNRYR
jgi:uncharacterized protein